MSDTSRAAERFNKLHAPAGSPAGGQFASSGGSGGAKGKDTRPTPTSQHPVGRGETGERVSDLQERLNAEGFKPPLKVDGIFGPKTLAAVRAFQKAHGLKVDGLVGPLTTAALRAKPAAAKHTPAHTTPKPAQASKPVHRSAADTAAGHALYVLRSRELRDAAGLVAAADETGAVRAGGQVTNPRGTERLHEYWVRGPGAAKIRWGEPNDFDRCVEYLGKYLADPKGYCNLAHKAATGMYPATHAAMEKHAGRADMAVTQRAEMASSSINDLPDDDFAYIEPGGTKDASGKTVPRSKRHFPVHDAAHVRNALARAPQSPFGDKAMPKIKARARKFGIDVSGDSSSASRAELFRTYGLEDAHIVRAGEGDSSGRLVEAYCAVFDDPVEIKDHQGHYIEDIDRTAFNKRIADVQRSRAGFGLVKCMYNHGLTIHGTPAERFSMPCAVTEHISAEGRGVLTRARYLDTALGNEVLELWRSGAITAQSFTGAIIRSSPELRRGDRYRPRGGELPRVRRLELGLREFGGTPFPAYDGAELVGVRMSPLGTWQAAGDDEEHEEQALPPDEEAAPGEPLTRTDGEEHSARYHQHALYRMTSEEKRKAAGLVW